MEPSQRHISYRPLRTPKAAAFAGLVFAVLQIASYWLMQSSLPAEALNEEALVQFALDLRLGLNLFPFAGIAFLWFCETDLGI